MRNRLDREAEGLLARSIAEGRLTAKPSLASLNRIAGIIAPVLAATPAAETAPGPTWRLINDKTVTKRTRNVPPTSQQPSRVRTSARPENREVRHGVRDTPRRT